MKNVLKIKVDHTQPLDVDGNPVGDARVYTKIVGFATVWENGKPTRGDGDISVDPELAVALIKGGFAEKVAGNTVSDEAKAFLTKDVPVRSYVRKSSASPEANTIG